ncbi:MAG TPA: s-methyl-5-thioribose-1-phosphate isomerase, partial [Acidimicrobiales bacterium]|nr:s-methyl-5-thioribose-1-phosphate isomerase [Acidimicrobiales bacterium]
MHVDGEPYRTIWRDPDRVAAVSVIDQRRLPFAFEVVSIDSPASMAQAIADMTVRGAGLIGAAAGFGMALAAEAAANRPIDEQPGLVRAAAAELEASRPTAVNLSWAVARQLDALSGLTDRALVDAAWAEAQTIADEDAEWCRQIGLHGVGLIEDVHAGTGTTVNILTHCNAGWLAFVDHGTATAPIYAAHDAGIPVHVWVDETRPRNQGALLTAWELGQHGVPHTVIVDNAGGHLMQHGM